MKNIMLNDTCGLTQATRDGTKIMTRRDELNPKNKHTEEEFGFINLLYDETLNKKIIFDGVNSFEIVYDGGFTNYFKAKYEVGERVAIAQSYKAIYAEFNYPEAEERKKIDDYCLEHLNCHYEKSKGWNNKMFVKPSLMPHHIEITDIRIEKLQDISDEDCIAEGITDIIVGCENRMWGYVNSNKGDYELFKTPREAYAALIDKISGNGTWKSNFYIIVYKFKNVD